MNTFRLKLKRLNTEPDVESLLDDFRSTPVSKQLSSRSGENERQCKQQSSDLNAFKLKQQINEQNFTCFKLIKPTYPTAFVTTAILNKLQFSSLSYPIKDLIMYAKSIIQSHSERRIIGRTFNLQKLIQLIAMNYRTNAYHNFTHAFSVLLLLFQAYNRSEQVQKCLTQKQWFYVFIAALAHDINHPGTTNNFETKRNTKLAVDAGYQSVLQKMHLNTFWKLLRTNSQVNFLQGYCASQSNEIKRLITRMILSTDSMKHFSSLKDLQLISKHKKPAKGDNATFVIEQLFHACDIGNSCLNFDNYLNWSVLISYELDQEVAREKELGLTVTTYLEYEGLCKFYQNQVNFCNGLALPLWRELSLVFPGLGEFVDNIRENIKQLNRKIQQELS